MRRVLAILIAATMCAVLVSGCNRDDSGDGGRNDTVRFGKGEIIKVGEVLAILNGVRKIEPDDLNVPVTEGNTFIIVDLTYDNSGDAPVEIASLLSLSLQDSTGVSVSSSPHTEARVFPDSDISGGRRNRGEIAFEVSPEATDLQLTLDAKALGREKVVWTLGDMSEIE